MNWVKIGELDIENTLDTINYMLQDEGAPKITFDQCKNELISYVSRQLKVYKQLNDIMLDMDGYIYKHINSNLDDAEIIDIIKKYCEDMPI